MPTVSQPIERRGNRGQRAAAFVVDTLIIAAMATPLWWLVHQRGIADAVVSGGISGLLFAAFYAVIYRETVGMRIVRLPRLRRRKLVR